MPIAQTITDNSDSKSTLVVSRSNNQQQQHRRNRKIINQKFSILYHFKVDDEANGTVKYIAHISN